MHLSSVDFLKDYMIISSTFPDNAKLRDQANQ